METALNDLPKDLPNIFFRIMLWAVIYQICHIVTTVTIQWITKYFKQAGAELCQAQIKLGLASNFLRIKSSWGEL